MPARYAIECWGSSAGASWAVVESATGAVVTLNNVSQSCLPHEEAADVADLLNDMDAQEPKHQA